MWRGRVVGGSCRARGSRVRDIASSTARSSTVTTSPLLPGRLGMPNLELRDDPRADPRMLAAMAPLGMDLSPPPSPVTVESPIADILESCMVSEAGFQMAFGMVNEPSTTSGRLVDGRDHHRRRRQRDHVVRPPTRQHRRAAPVRGPHPRGRHGDPAGVRSELRQVARRTRRHRARGGRRRVPQRRGGTRPAPVPRRTERLCERRAVGDREPGGAGGVDGDHLR